MHLRATARAGAQDRARSLTIDNRTVDLHHLHCEMIKEGGSGVVCGFFRLFFFVLMF